MLRMADNTLEKAFERAINIAARDQLAERLPHLAMTIACASTAKPGPLRDRLLQTVIDQIAAYDSMRTAMPFLSRLQQPTGTFSVGNEKTRGTPILLDPVDLASHTLISGSTGSAKTSFAKHLVTNLQAADSSVQVCYVDPNKDWQCFALRDQQCIIMTDETPLCITVCPSFLTQDYYDQLVAKTFAEASYGANNTIRLLTATTKAVRVKHPNGHSIKDLRNAIATTPAKTFSEKDTVNGTLSRIDLLAATLPGTYDATPPCCLTMEDLCRNPVWWTVRSRLSTYEFLIALWIQILMEYHGQKKDAGLTLIVMDEGLQLWQGDARHRIGGSPLLDHALSQTRSKHIGFLITTTSTREVSQMVRANTNLQVTMRLVDGSEVEEARRTFRLNPDQAAYLHHQLQRGEGLLRQSNKYPEALLVTFPRTDEDPINDKDWNDTARQRTENLLPVEPPIPVAEPVPEQPPSPTPQDDETTPIALNNSERALLRFVATNGGITTVKEAYDGAGLHPSIGDAAKQKLFRLGLITATPIIAGSGKGKGALAIELTTEAYARIKMRPPRRSRGGGSQSEYLIQKLHRLLPGSQIEVTLG